MSDPRSQSTCLLVTGASSGIGRAMAIDLSRDRRLILHGRDVARLDETRLLCDDPDRHLCWPSDLNDVDALDGELTGFMKSNAVHVDAFVHCAAMLDVLPIRSLPAAKVKAMMNVNALAALEIVRLLMRRQVNGKSLANVVFISTIASQFGARGFTAYCASKAALDGIMRALAVELAPAVRVNSVLPGGVRTPMTETMYADPGTAERLLRDYPLGVGLPSDISDAVSFLLSAQSRWITGQQIVVDGGRTVNISA